MSVVGEPPGVSLKRDQQVARELWNALGRNIAPGRARYLSDDTVIVPLERFLATRNWLVRALTSFDCAAVLAGDLGMMLRREDAERGEIDTILSGSRVELGASVVSGLVSATRICRELRPFQLRDLARMLSISHGANFSVPGAGKTEVAYALYEIERMRGRVERLLVVAPLSAFDAWFEEARECLRPCPAIRRLKTRPLPGTEVLLVNYQRLVARYEQVAAWVLGARTHVILDEAHRMKRGRDGEWGTACLNLAHLAVRRDILTGTPAPQHPSDFGALFEFVWPHQSTRILPRGAFHSDPSPPTMVEISRRLGPLFARTRKDELGLDAPTLRVEVVQMKPLQAQIYEALRTRMRHVLNATGRDRNVFGDMGGVVMYMLEAATNPALLAAALGGQPSETRWPPDAIPAGSTLAERVLAYSRHETPRKFEVLATMVAANAERGLKTLVWSNFIANITDLARVLAPHNPAVIYGGVPSGEEADYATRESELRRFRQQDACRVLIANPAAMSEGVSLHHACHDAIYLERTFNAGQYLQSLDRIHRLGLAPGTETRITFLQSEGTIDETVDARVRRKAQRLSEMLSDPNLVTMALPDEEAYGSCVDTDDVEAILAHLEST